MKAKKVLTVLTSLLLLAPTTVNASENYTSLFQPVVRGDQSSESVYFVMTDRFSDGNPSNNGDGYDPTDIGYWHGGDFQGLTEKRLRSGLRHLLSSNLFKEIHLPITAIGRSTS